jgi:hypothetical protein
VSNKKKKRVLSITYTLFAQHNLGPAARTTGYYFVDIYLLVTVTPFKKPKYITYIARCIQTIHSG